MIADLIKATADGAERITLLPRKTPIPSTLIIARREATWEPADGNFFRKHQKHRHCEAQNERGNPYGGSVYRNA
jgi:hypothetical protein